MADARTYIVHLDNDEVVTIPGVSHTELSDKKWLNLYDAFAPSGAHLLAKFNMDRVMYTTVEYPVEIQRG